MTLGFQRRVLCALVVVAVPLAACGVPSWTQRPTPERIIIRAEDGLPPPRTPGPVSTPEPPGEQAAPGQPYPSPAHTATPTPLPQAQP